MHPILEQDSKKMAEWLFANYAGKTVTKRFIKNNFDDIPYNRACAAMGVLRTFGMVVTGRYVRVPIDARKDLTVNDVIDSNTSTSTE